MAVLKHASRARRAFLFALTVVVVAGTPTPPSAVAAPVVTSEAVYAAFTVNLTRFISWPREAMGPPDAPFVIGTFARDPINPELDAAAQGETVGGHPVVTVRLRTLDDLLKCRLIYVSHGVADIGAVLRRVERRPILTISDADGFLALGGHVRFVPQRTRTALHVSAANLRASGLEARAQLLRIASSP